MLSDQGWLIRNIQNSPLQDTQYHQVYKKSQSNLIILTYQSKCRLRFRLTESEKELEYLEDTYFDELIKILTDRGTIPKSYR